MRLSSARVQKYRSVKDTGWFDVEEQKTILVGSNEAGKSAVLQALQQLNPPNGVAGFEALRDYPRSEYNDITTRVVDPDKVEVVSAKFSLEADDIAELPVGYDHAQYKMSRYLSNRATYSIEGGPARTVISAALRKDLARMAAHTDQQYAGESAGSPSSRLTALTHAWRDNFYMTEAQGTELRGWLDSIVTFVDETNTAEEKRHDKLIALADSPADYLAALTTLGRRTPVFVLFNNYFRVRPLIHLKHLADRLDNNTLDDKQYDYGNQCLMKLLGFSARDLSNLGNAPEPPASDPDALKAYRDQLDRRSYQLNAASVRLTDEIRGVWHPDRARAEADRLRVQADGQYLKVVVEDDLGVEIELDQRSEGFQWLVSFFVVFFAEASGRHKNAILLLDEPGLSLHGLKQREFRSTVSKLAGQNQTVYTTHSPFMVGPDELDIVRVVEMTDRRAGTRIHTTVTATDAASLLPLQEALGYDLAQSLFAQKRNLVLEGLTDYWYIDATAQMLRDADLTDLDNRIAMLPAEGTGKVTYFATFLHANNLKVAALLDSDAAGDNAAQQETLVHTLGNKNILRTKDAYAGPVNKSEIEDLLRETLIVVAKADLGWDIQATAASQPARPIVDIFAREISGFSKYKLAKAYLRWTRTHGAGDLTNEEQAQWKTLITLINKALK
jgi:AAA ATPase domain/Overcoming lysogenization defect protein-like, TOPRIM domain